MKSTTNLLILALVASGVVACSKKGSHTTEFRTIETLKTIEKENVKLISTFTYTLEDNGCSTGTQVFSTIEDMCKGLQNNTLNNNCALEVREDFFKKNCTGTEFVAFDDQSLSAESSFSEVLEPKKMKNGDISAELIKVTPIGKSKKSVMASFACAASLEDAQRLENGFIFLNGSRAIINRDQSLNSRKYPQAVFECVDANAEQSNEVLNEALIKTVTVKPGHATAEYVVISGERPEVTKSELSYISCSDSKTEIMNSLTNGLNLIKGTRLLVRRDLNALQSNGINEGQEFALITCD